MWNNDGGQNAGGFGDQGGGYLNSPGFNTTQNPSQERRRPQRAQSCLPCTVAQIYKANQQDDSFYIEGTEVHQITIIGIVRSVKESATRLDYEIDDMTGPPLEVRQFVDNDEDTPDNERTLAARENTYVRMYGHIRGFGGKTSVVAFRVVPLVDMNELTMHLLEVMHSHMVLTKAQSTGGGDTTQAGMDYTAQGSGYQADYGLTPIQSQVQAVIRGCPDEQGISVSNIAQKLRGLPPQSLKEAIEFLSGEGHIYSTVDDEHYRSTDAM